MAGRALEAAPRQAVHVAGRETALPLHSHGKNEAGASGGGRTAARR